MGYIASEPRLLRPANYPAGVPGRGSYVAQTGDGRSVGVINVMGRVFMLNIDDPFAVVLKEIDALRHRTRVIIVDFHAEATSEKIAMGWHLDGKVTLVVGTHTHVQTADERILPNGTAYMTDAGMTGPHDGIIGMEREPSLERFLSGMPTKFEPASANPRLNGVLVSADEKTGRATAVTRLSYSEQELGALAARVRAGVIGAIANPATFARSAPASLAETERRRESRVPSPESRAPSPESRAPSPEPRAPSPESPVPSPGRR
jgi:metallophosphoesterase (TIGR00282 family)